MRSTLVLTVVTDGWFSGRRYVVHPDQRLLLGRTEAADLVIGDALVGSRQTWLWYQEGTWMVEDARSIAGTYVDGTQASRPTPLPYGAILWAGGLHLRASEGAPDEPPSVPRWVPGSESRVVLCDDAVWTAPRAECEQLALLLDVSSAPVLRPARQGGTVDLRHATGVELLALLGSIESELARPAFTPAVQELCHLLRSDVRVASYPLGTPSASDAIRIVNALAMRTEDSARRFFRTPGRPEWPALVLRAIASHPNLGPGWAAHYGDRILPFLDEQARAEAVTAMADIALPGERTAGTGPDER